MVRRNGFRFAGIAGMTAMMMIVCGCDEQAREFASKTKAILDQRSHQLSDRIAAEKKDYNSSAAHNLEAQIDILDSLLSNERNERADVLAADYDEGRKPVSLWRVEISSYASIDYTNSRELVLSESGATSQFQQSFEDLTVEQGKVDALAKLFSALEKKPSLKEDIQSLSTFGSDTDSEFDKKVCSTLKSQESSRDPKTSAPAKAAYAAKKCDGTTKTAS